MKQLLILSLLMFGLGFAQQEASLSGVIKTKGEIPEGTRVAIHLTDRDNAWQREVASVVPAVGTFSISPAMVEPGELSPFRSGAMLFPGLQNEYSVEPSDVNYARALVDMYVDTNENAVFDNPAVDRVYIGIASLEAPVGFFSLVYVDKDATITGKGASLTFKQGWNIFTVRFPEGGDTIYEVMPAVEDIVMDVFLP